MYNVEDIVRSVVNKNNCTYKIVNIRYRVGRSPLYDLQLVTNGSSKVTDGKVYSGIYGQDIESVRLTNATKVARRKASCGVKGDKDET